MLDIRPSYNNIKDLLYKVSKKPGENVTVEVDGHKYVRSKKFLSYNSEWFEVLPTHKFKDSNLVLWYWCRGSNWNFLSLGANHCESRPGALLCLQYALHGLRDVGALYEKKRFHSQAESCFAQLWSRRYGKFFSDKSDNRVIFSDKFEESHILSVKLPQKSQFSS